MAGVLAAALTLVAAGAAWGGLGWLMANVPPSRPLAVLAAYVFAFAAITSSGALLAWLALRPRLEEGRLRSPAGYLAHSMLLAVIILFAIWLQTLRTLTPIVAMLLIGLYAILELAVLFGTRGWLELPFGRGPPPKDRARPPAGEPIEEPVRSVRAALRLGARSLCRRRR